MTEYQYTDTQSLIDSNKYPFTREQFRYLLRHRDKNGLNKAARKIGKCIYWRSDLFDEWIESHAETTE